MSGIFRYCLAGNYHVSGIGNSSLPHIWQGSFFRGKYNGCHNKQAQPIKALTSTVSKLLIGYSCLFRQPHLFIIMVFFLQDFQMEQPSLSTKITAYLQPIGICNKQELRLTGMIQTLTSWLMFVCISNSGARKILIGIKYCLPLFSE